MNFLNGSAGAPKAPDFAFPKQVAATAESDYAKAMKSGKDVEALRALIDLTIAKTLVDNDEAASCIEKISRYNESARTPVGKALGSLLLARFYSEVYAGNSYVYNGRNNVVSTPAADISEWSGNMFRAEIDTCLSRAMAYKAELLKAPIADYREVVMVDKDSELFYPTLFDFVVTTAVSITTEINQSLGNLPATLVEPYPEVCAVSLDYISPAAREVILDYYQLLGYYRPGSPQWINYQLGLLQFVKSRVAYGSEDDGIFEVYKALYGRYHDDEYSGMILEKMASRAASPDDKIWVYDHCIDFLRKFQAYPMRGNLQYVINNLERQELSMQMPEIVGVGSPVKIAVSGSNVNDFAIDVYRLTVPEQSSSIDYKDLKLLRPLDSIKGRVEGRKPFTVDTVVEYSFPGYGRYAFVPRFDGMAAPGEWRRYSIVTCTNLFVGEESYSDRRALVVDPVTGKPVVDAEVYKHKRNSVRSKVGKTGNDGCVKLPKDNDLTLVAVKDGVASAPASGGYYYERGSQRKAVGNISLLSSLALYRPGDTVEWALVFTESTLQSKRPVANAKVNVQFYDANGMELDSIMVKTDSYGRAEGSFTVPKGRLTGTYSIRAKAKSPEASGWLGVTVSDYKLPTFEIVAESPLVGFPSEGDVTIRGKVKTYSGFALADVPVTLDLKSSSGWWRWFIGNEVDFYSSSDNTTDKDGNFNIVLPSALLSQAPYPDGSFTAQLTAVSPSGETQQASTWFTRRKKPALMVGSITNLDVTNPLMLDVKVLNAEGEEIKTMIDYTIASGEIVVSRGSFTTGEKVDWSSVPRGCYDITFKLSGTDDKDATETVKDVCIYRPTDKYSPSPELLWTPTDNVIVDGNRAEILVGTSAQSTSMLVSVWDDRGYLLQKWFDLEPRLYRIPVEIPDTCSMVHCTVTTVNNFRYKKIEVNVTPRRSLQGVKLETTSFRDKIVPGTPEQWTFKVTGVDGEPVQAAIMLDMYNKALDRLARQSWSLFVPSLQGRSFNISLTGVADLCYESARGRSRSSVANFYISTPDFLTWGYPLFSSGYSHFRGGPRLYMSMAKQSVVAEYKMDMDEEAIMDTDDMGVSNDAVNATGEVAETPADDAADSGEYRPSEIALALFRPMLTTDADGLLKLSFTAPQAVTTWQLRALAFTDDMQLGSLAREVLSSKPLMVQANLPRFLRTGDDALLSAMVMNNSDEVLDITTVVELFNPSTAEVMKAESFTNHLEPGASAAVTVATGVVGEDTMLGYRVRSTSGSYTDGEQSVMPVLSTITPVIETAPFYSAPSQKVISVEVPGEKGDDCHVTLQYCENPLWTVVSALPGLSSTSPLTANAAAEAIYGAAVAGYIVNKNPEVGAALRAWTASNRSDSTLVSMLERNADLKNLLLQATPWMVNAMTDSERMERLALLFDRKQIDATIQGAIDVLARHVCPDGGFAWYASGRGELSSSEWPTLRVLTLLGALQEQGSLPESRRLESMIDNALKYIDAKVAADYNRDPRRRFMNYVFMRQRFPDVKIPTATTRAINATVQELVAEWKEMRDVENKAIAAMVLERAKYHLTAKNVIRSLGEYAIESPLRGMTWKTPWEPYGSVYTTALVLQAWSVVEPSSPDIEKIRQWLILQKETLDWGDQTATTAAVNAILSTSSRWVRPARQATFYLDGEELKPAASPEFYSGYLRTALPASSLGETLEVVKGDADTPAYGAVYCQYRARMDKIEPAECDDLSIAKKFYLRRGTLWIPADGEALTVGDRVRIELVVTASRDIDYVAITDERAACFEPIEQMPEPIVSDGVWIYRENLDAETRMMVDRLPKGVYRLSYEVTVNNAGSFTSGIATVQSQYAPQLTAHSGGTILKTRP